MMDSNQPSTLLGRIAALEADLARERRERADAEAAAGKKLAALEQALERAVDPRGDRAQKIFQNAADAILLVDGSGTYTYATASIERVTGYTVEETVGTNAMAWLHPEDIASHLTKLQTLREKNWVDGPSPVTQYRRKHKTRGWVWVEALGANLLDDPAVGAIVVTMRDMTERRRIQEELQRAKEEAEAASSAKSAFLANMSHELRTPLNGVIGMVDLLARSPLDERQRRYTEVARSSADLLLAVINDILDFSKIEAGKLDLESVPFSLVEVVEEAADILALAAEQKGLELSCRTSPALARPVLGDPARLRQILVNLINNAVKFTPGGEVAIGASQLEDRGDTVLVRIDVRDTGIGISEAAQRRLFQPFNQVDASTTRHYGGTGLGLAICRQLTARMGGAVSVVSAEGQGALFSVVLPLKYAPGAVVEEHPAAAPRLAGLHILAVDDNATNREVLKEQLGGVGMRCDCAASGPAALRMLAEAAGNDPYALAIVDVSMPEMDGLALVRLIKADPRLASTVLVILGSLGKPLSVDEQRALGIAGYASKPVGRRALLRKLGAAWTGAASSVVPPPLPSMAPTPDGPLRALLVEDSSINAEVAGELLRSVGIEFDVAVNGVLAVAAALERPYDVVLMDCQLPEMDGFEAPRRIREHERAGAVPGRAGARLPILALTAGATTTDLRHCQQAGMDDCLTKPIDPRNLFEAITRSTGRRL